MEYYVQCGHCIASMADIAWTLSVGMIPDYNVGNIEAVDNMVSLSNSTKGTTAGRNKLQQPITLYDIQ